MTESELIALRLDDACIVELVRTRGKALVTIALWNDQLVQVVFFGPILIQETWSIGSEDLVRLTIDHITPELLNPFACCLERDQLEEISDGHFRLFRIYREELDKPVLSILFKTMECNALQNVYIRT